MDPHALITLLEWTRQGGLFVPTSDTRRSAEGFSPTPPVRAALSYSSVFSDSLSLDEIIERVRQIPRFSWLKFTAGISAAIALKGAFNPFFEQFIEQYLVQDYKDTALAYVQHEGYAAFSPICLPAIAKLAIAYAPDTVDAVLENNLDFMFLTYIALGDHVPWSSLDDGENNPVAALTRMGVQNLDYAMNISDFEALSRVWALLVQLPTQQDTCSILPAEIFASATHLTITRFLAMAFSITGSKHQIDFDSAESLANNLFLRKSVLFQKTQYRRIYFEDAGKPENGVWTGQEVYINTNFVSFNPPKPTSFVCRQVISCQLSLEYSFSGNNDSIQPEKSSNDLQNKVNF